jgi:hypothetical protein
MRCGAERCSKRATRLISQGDYRLVWPGGDPAVMQRSSAEQHTAKPTLTRLCSRPACANAAVRRSASGDAHAMRGHALLGHLSPPPLASAKQVYGRHPPARAEGKPRTSFQVVLEAEPATGAARGPSNDPKFTTVNDNNDPPWSPCGLLGSQQSFRVSTSSREALGTRCISHHGPSSSPSNAGRSPVGSMYQAVSLIRDSQRPCGHH